MKTLVRLTLPVAALALVAGCGGGSGSSSKNQTITVLAAASLTGAFTTLGQDFEKAHPGIKVQFSFGPSSGLSDQITSGSPADVFASAATSNMEDVVKAGDAKNPTDFVSNKMEIAVPPSNPGKVTGLDSLAGKGVKVALCQAEVPCGVVAYQVFKNAGITVKPVSEEVDVKSVLTKVQLDEVDAGVVYVTDVKAAGSKVLGVPIADGVNATTTYPIATLKGSKHASTAQQFVDYVLSKHGQQVLAGAGFSAP